ncbi:MAG: hypothetical protein JO013_06110 [Alphaproteobacteria bacterium]|nr:hypothetical protein [Alphaproteobacteria bacterium]
MTNAAALREKAEQLRTLAREYAPDVGFPLSLKATRLEREAAELERQGRERRLPPLTLRERALFPSPRPFGRRGLR